MRFLICLLAVAFSIGCGDGGTEYEYRTPAAPKPPPETPQAPNDEGKPTPPVVAGPSPDELKEIALGAVVKNCANCHGGSQSPSLKNEDEILANADLVCVRTGNGTMPPGGAISGGDKDKILKGLGC